MMALEGTRAARFELVTAGHHFIVRALPLRDPETRQALYAFIHRVANCRVPSLDREAVLLELLAALNPHGGERIPSLVDRFLACRHTANGLTRFERCVEDLLRYRGIGNAAVQRAIGAMMDRHFDPSLRESEIAELAGLSAASLCVAFKAQTGMTTMEYLRDIRLNKAARKLLQSNNSVKEISWAVGYRHVSNFDHDFKGQFNRTPTEFRIGGMCSKQSGPHLADHGSASDQRDPASRRLRVLIADDDPGTREALEIQLRRAGCVTECVESSVAALEAVRTTRPDVIVLDVHLGEVDGMEMLQELRRRVPGHYPPVILFTADYEVEESANDLYELGATMVPKLCDLDEFQRIVLSLGTISPPWPSQS